MATISRNVPELLAPAGNIECLHAAVCAGADAVYLGLGEHNARIKSSDFKFIKSVFVFLYSCMLVIIASCILSSNLKSLNVSFILLPPLF